MNIGNRNFVLLIILFVAVLFGCSNVGKKEAASGPEVIRWLEYKGDPDQPTIVLIAGDEEYRSEEALPQLAAILAAHHGFNCTVLFAQDPAKPGILNPNFLGNIPGLEKLEEADLMILFTRFRALPDEQMQQFDQYLLAGKPVIGIRTATHAFNFEKVDFESKYAHYSNYYDGDDSWKGGFGRLVLGEKWITHHGQHKGQSTRGIAATGASGHPILKGIAQTDIWGPTDVYGVRLPLPDDAQPIVLGQVINRSGEFNESDSMYGMRPTDIEIAKVKIIKDEDGQEKEIDPNNPMMPIAWTKSYQLPGGVTGKSFTTTIGAAIDLLNEGTRRMLVNSVYWTMDLEVPPAANVDLVGNYNPTAYGFLETSYWIEKNKKISDIK